MANPFNWETDNVDNKNDIIRLTLAVLSALKVLIGAIGYNFFTDEIAVALENLIPLIFILVGVWRNNYISNKGKAQKAVLEEHDLVKKDLF